MLQELIFLGTKQKTLLLTRKILETIVGERLVSTDVRKNTAGQEEFYIRTKHEGVTLYRCVFAKPPRKETYRILIFERPSVV